MKFLILIALITVYVQCTLIKEPWAVWTPCYNSTTNDISHSVKCGGGVSVRSRECLHVESNTTFTCETTEAVCKQSPCYDPYEGEIWSDCNADCEGGQRSIEGVDINGGFVSMEIDCHNQECTNLEQICHPVDIVIILDSSGSIGEEWIILKQFIIDFLKGLQIESLTSRIGIITYSNEVEDIINLGSIDNFENLEDLIWDLDYITGGTHTSEAFVEMKNQFETYHQTHNAMIGLVISDAMSNIDIDLTVPNAQLVKEMNVTMLGIGVGDFDHWEMGNITSLPLNNTLFETQDFRTLKNVIHTVLRKVCDPFTVKECTPCDITGGECQGSTCNAPGFIPGTRQCVSVDSATMIEIETEESCSLVCDKKCTDADCYRCDFTKGQLWRPKADNCHQYYICEPMDEHLVYRHHLMTCGNLYWDQESFSCTTTVSGNCTVGFNVTAAPENSTQVDCPFTIYNGDDTKFWRSGLDHTIITCPLGLFFDDSDSLCTCVQRIGVSVPTDMCEDDLLLHFPYDDHYNDVTCHRAQAIEYGSGLTLADGKACFNGSSYLEVPFLRNWFSSQRVQAFSIEMNYTTTSPAPGLAGVVNNGDCVEHPSIALSTLVNADSTNNIYGEIETDGTGVERSPSTQNTDATWVHMVWVYNGVSLKVYKNTVLVSEVPVNGDILNTQVPLRIGTICEVPTEQENFFNGCIEDLKLWNKVIPV